MPVMEMNFEGHGAYCTALMCDTKPVVADRQMSGCGMFQPKLMGGELNLDYETVLYSNLLDNDKPCVDFNMCSKSKAKNYLSFTL